MSGIIAIALRHMFAAGMDNSAIMAAVAEMETFLGGLPLTPRQDDDYESMFPSKEAKRAFEYRQRKRDASVTKRDESVTKRDASVTNVTKRDESVTTVTPPSPSSPYDNKNSSTPSNPILTPLPLKKENRAKRLPEDWQPSEGLFSSKEVQNLGLPREVLNFETEAFRDHFLGNGARKIDWDRTWKNWMREAKRRQSRFAPKSNVVTGSFRKELKPEPEGPKISEEERQANLAKLTNLVSSTLKWKGLKSGNS
jgi:hypothetical protein